MYNVCSGPNRALIIRFCFRRDGFAGSLTASEYVRQVVILPHLPNCPWQTNHRTNYITCRAEPSRVLLWLGTSGAKLYNMWRVLGGLEIGNSNGFSSCQTCKEWGRSYFEFLQILRRWSNASKSRVGPNGGYFFALSASSGSVSNLKCWGQCFEEILWLYVDLATTYRIMAWILTECNFLYRRLKKNRKERVRRGQRLRTEDECARSQQLAGKRSVKNWVASFGWGLKAKKITFRAAI